MSALVSRVYVMPYGTFVSLLLGSMWSVHGCRLHSKLFQTLINPHAIVALYQTSGCPMLHARMKRAGTRLVPGAPPGAATPAVSPRAALSFLTLFKSPTKTPAARDAPLTFGPAGLRFSSFLNSVYSFSNLSPASTQDAQSFSLSSSDAPVLHRAPITEPLLLIQGRGHKICSLLRSMMVGRNRGHFNDMPPQCSHCLPSLAGLSPSALSKGGSTDERFEDYDSARGSVPSRFEQKDWWAEDAECAICSKRLSEVSDANTRFRHDNTVPVRDNSIEIMALIEDPDCGHVFHFACLQSSVLAYDADDNPDRPLRCPVCSTPIHQRNLDELVESTVLEGEVEEVEDLEEEQTEQGAQ